MFASSKQNIGLEDTNFPWAPTSHCKARFSVDRP